MQSAEGRSDPVEIVPDEEEGGEKGPIAAS